MDWKVPLADLSYGVEEEQAVLDVLHRKWLTMGSVTQQFEAEFARLVGARYAFAVTNATAALHLACLALGIGPGDEVIVPSLTFVATANCVGHAGGKVCFADICSLTDLTISPEDIERRITPRTRAIIIVHYGGYPCQMDAIQSICQRYGLALVEDACHTPGADYNGRSLGTWGDAGCYSFFSNKNLATGEGGMLVTNRDDIAEQVSLLRSHAMTTLTWDRHEGRAYSYDVVGLGYNYRIDEIRSALGLAQLHKLVEGNHRRQEITCQYWQAFANTPLTLPFARLVAGQKAGASPQIQSSCHLFPILLPPEANREQFMANLKAQGVQSSIHYPPIHTFSYYRKLEPNLHLPVTEDAAARQVTLPLYPTMTTEQVDLVIAAVKHAL